MNCQSQGGGTKVYIATFTSHKNQPDVGVYIFIIYIYIYIYIIHGSYGICNLHKTHLGAFVSGDIQTSNLTGRKHGWVDASYLHGFPSLRCRENGCGAFRLGDLRVSNLGHLEHRSATGKTKSRILSRRAWTLSRKTRTKKTYPVKKPRGWLGWAMEIQWIFERFTLGSWNGGRTKSSWSTMSCYLRRWLGRCIVFFLFFFGWALDDITLVEPTQTTRLTTSQGGK